MPSDRPGENTDRLLPFASIPKSRQGLFGRRPPPPHGAPINRRKTFAVNVL